MSHFVTAEHLRLAEELVAETRANQGLAPVDLERFYADQEIAGKAPFGAHIPQSPLGVWMSGECVYDELGIAQDFWRYDHDEPWRLELNRAYNDRAERIVGKRLLNEKPGNPAHRWPGVKGLHDIFEAKNVWQQESQSYWLEQVCGTPEELTRLLDRVDARLADPAQLRGFILPPNWDEEAARLQALGLKPALYRHQRGPVTFATSIYGVEPLLFLIMEEPELAARLRDTILRAMLALGEIRDRAAGYTRETAPHGFSFADDNCCLLTPRMYEFFGWPVLQGVFARYSPNPGDNRYQHSDSDMGHLLPLLGRLNMTGANFGPKVQVKEIRQHLPLAVIYGQLAPFTFSRDQEVNIVAEFIRDFEQAREHRGLVFATAGSINNGSRLTGMRLIMAAIQRYGRFR